MPAGGELVALKAFAPPSVDRSPEFLLARAERQVARERAARLEAEAIAEKGLRDLYESKQRLLLLQRVTEGANRASGVEAALQHALAEFGSHLGWALGNAYMRDGDRVVGTTGWRAVETDDLVEFVNASVEACFVSGIGLPGRVIDDPRPHWVENIASDDNFPRAQVAARCGLTTACAFPVLVGDEVVAVFEFFTRKSLPSNAEMISIMKQVGTQLGRVIERDRARRALIHDALHDAMTGLPNRILFNDRLDNAFQRVCRRANEQMSLLVLDLDGFKTVNDSLGHHAGDGLLVAVASQLRECMDCCDKAARQRQHPIQTTVARTGGDEFVILIDGVEAEDEAMRMAEAIHQRLRQAITIEGRSIHIGASIGIAHHRPSYDDAGQLVRDADLAMYDAKVRGRGCTAVFSEALGEELRSANAFEQELREAIQRREFVLHYQPIVTFGKDQAIQGFEALLRWNHPTRGLLAPDRFIEVAEKTGLILLIGDWVLREACRTVSRWHKANPERQPFISINISPKQFLQPEFGQRVLEIMLETEINPACVRLEVTEGVAVIDAERTRRVIDEIRSWGVKTSLDDFGTGFSSLSYLQSLPFDSIKIDRSFVKAMNGSRQSEGIVRAIMDLARTLKMNVVAEGIETLEQEQKLIALGCDLGQGYRFGRPVDEKSAYDLLYADASTERKRLPARAR